MLRPDVPEKAKALVDQLIATDTAATTGVIFLELLAGSKTEQEFTETESGSAYLLSYRTGALD